MSVLVTRATAAKGPRSSRDRADVFARGVVAVLVVADGAGGDGGAAADRFLTAARDAVLDGAFDLEATSSWRRLFEDVDRGLARDAIGETTGVVVVIGGANALVASSGDSETWRLSAGRFERLAGTGSRARLGTGAAAPELVAIGGDAERLLVATDGLFRHAPGARIEELVRTSPFGAVADALVAAARLPAGALADDVAVLVAERA